MAGILDMKGRRKIAEIFIDQMGQFTMNSPQNTNIYELETALWTMARMVMETRIKAELQRESQTAIINPFTGRNFMKQDGKQN